LRTIKARSRYQVTTTYPDSLFFPISEVNDMRGEKVYPCFAMLELSTSSAILGSETVVTRAMNALVIEQDPGKKEMLMGPIQC
jgi:hypothetical protein